MEARNSVGAKVARSAEFLRQRFSEASSLLCCEHLFNGWFRPRLRPSPGGRGIGVRKKWGEPMRQGILATEHLIPAKGGAGSLFRLGIAAACGCPSFGDCQHLCVARFGGLRLCLKAQKPDKSDRLRRPACARRVKGFLNWAGGFSPALPSYGQSARPASIFFLDVWVTA